MIMMGKDRVLESVNFNCIIMRVGGGQGIRVREPYTHDYEG